MTRSFARIAGLLPVMAVAVLALPAHAQDGAEDWDLTVDPAQQQTMAALNFGDNAVGLRCKAGALQFLLTGGPPSAVAERQVRVTAGAIADENQTWSSPPGLPVLFAPEPGRMARQLRSGGDLSLRVEPVDAAERTLRYRLPIPPSAASIDRVLEACGEPLTDDWDALPRLASSSLIWRTRIRPDFPARAVRAGASGGVVRLGCLLPADSRLQDCRVLSESPRGVGFGDSALRAARQSDVVLPESVAVGQLVSFVVRFPEPN